MYTLKDFGACAARGRRIERAPHHSHTTMMDRDNIQVPDLALR